jgi:DNA-nicking Smr family endonuclease
MNARPNGDEILRYVEKHGVQDKDASRSSRQTRAGKGAISRSRKGSFRKTIDLHGMDSVSAEQVLKNALADCKRRGITQILIIHGRGVHSDPTEGGVLKKMVRDNLEFRYAAAIRSFGPALPHEGGDGATVVRLK